MKEASELVFDDGNESEKKYDSFSQIEHDVPFFYAYKGNIRPSLEEIEKGRKD